MYNIVQESVALRLAVLCAQGFPEYTWVTENARKFYEHVREEDAIGYLSDELIEMAMIRSLFSEISMVCYTDRNEQTQVLYGFA